MTEEEKELINLFSGHRQNEHSSRTLFLCDHSKSVKKLLITELKKFLTIYGAIPYFGKKKNDHINIVSPKSRLNFSVEPLLYKENLTLQIT